ncbi:unnamed protein product [Camellia sinensis]|uniref:Uncharacterized protein n=2 Tax=Camellia TaxID=4441 RepID=A0A7J7GWW4_CAMSI|nr:tetraspanin-8-like isoform X1 [Camellia sinensis]KAF5945273.1 hypothetical protein HYC85_015501 [Camellia sinensis]KAI8022149.1 Tetraspanin-9 [Camellia lanceoleosa]
MVEFTNVVITSCNFFGLLLSIVPIASATYIFINGPVSCDDESPVVTMALGVFILVMSVVGLIGATAKCRVLMLTYLWMFSVVIVMALCMTTITFVVTSNSPADVVKASRGYKLKEFMPLFTKYMVNDGKWVDAKNCMIEQHFCKIRLLNATDNEVEYTKQFGCCRPPPQCGFVPRQNETSWELPKKGLASKDHDCVAWSSNRDKMCYDCESCKAGHVAARVIELHGDSGFCIGFPIFLFIIFGIAYCALRNSNQKCRGCV